MDNITREDFLKKSMVMGAASMFVPSIFGSTLPAATPRLIKDDISLAQWSLVDEVKAGKWKTLDFAKIARKDFGLNGIELVNTLFESPTESYLQKLNKNAADNGVTMVLIMVDAEGDGCSPTKEERRQFEINHRKWIDIARYLGCKAIRTNCRGADNNSKEEALKWSTETYQMIMEYAVPANISVLIENHGGISNDPDWTISLFKAVDNLYFGSYPDWRKPEPDFDNVNYLTKMLPYARGMSYRNQPTEELTAKMIKLVKDSGYRGWYGIESKGREEIIKGIGLLKRYLSIG